MGVSRRAGLPFQEAPGLGEHILVLHPAAILQFLPIQGENLPNLLASPAVQPCTRSPPVYPDVFLQAAYAVLLHVFLPFPSIEVHEVFRTVPIRQDIPKFQPELQHLLRVGDIHPHPPGLQQLRGPGIEILHLDLLKFFV